MGLEVKAGVGTTLGELGVAFSIWMWGAIVVETEGVGIGSKAQGV